ncbi:MAG: hypothetical protein ACT4NV_02150 [Rhodoferax sp.]
MTKSVSFNVAAGTQTSSSPRMTVGIYNTATGASVSAISFSGTYEVRATLVDASNVPMPGVLVAFSMGSYTSATLGASSAVTGSDGIARVSVTPSSITAVGGALVTAQTASGTSVSGQAVFSVSATSVTLNPIQLGSSSLASSGNTSVSVQTSVTGFSINVTITASCGRINGAALTASVATTGAGLASATYDAVNADGSLCSGTVSLTASATNATSVSTTLTVATPTANAVTYVTTGSVRLFVVGSGGVEQGVLQYKVLDSTGVALANQGVSFSIVSNPGGAGIGSPGNTSAVTGTSGSDGVVKISVFSGSIPGPLKVRAALQSNSSVFTDSQNVTIASGPPSQRYFSVSIGTPNIEGANIDGTATTITARVADRQGNAVDDGTVVNFTTEGGQVGYSCATTTVNKIASCSVELSSQNFRPSNGRVTVLAYVEGTKDYVDNNFDNKFTSADTLVNIGDAYRDDDEDGTWDVGEFRIPRGVSGGTCSTVGGNYPSIAGTCDDLLPTTVRQEVVVFFSTSTPTFSSVTTNVNYVSFNMGSSAFGGANSYLLLPMPAGTTVSAEASGNSGACTVDKVFGATVPNVFGTVGSPSEDLKTGHTVTLKSCTSGSLVAIKVKAPSGLETTYSITIP